MSSFLVAYETIDNIVGAALTQGVITPRRASTYGRRLINLNKTALQERYGDKPDRTDYAYRAQTAAPVQVRKSIECFLYQCAEGDVPSTDLFKEVEKISAVVGSTIGTTGPDGSFVIDSSLAAAYNAAEWG